MTSAEDLLSWYDRHRRRLPWRESRDPYRVWLSEVMLQQTRVETVVPYYERILARFPAIEDLAAAPLEEVLALWSGLGYYRRARQMHAAARLVAESGGHFPRSLDGLRSLPGVGPYTAAAVASIAFGHAVPVLDGNVERVVARLLAERGDPKSKEVRRRLLAEAGRLLSAERPGDSNQALMELGATVCTPAKPRCPICPLAAVCRAGRRGEAESIPAPRKRRATERRVWAIAVAEKAGRVLLFRRPDGSALLASTWELPWWAAGPTGELEATRVEDGLAASYGGSWTLGSHLGTARHGITFRDLRLEVFAAVVERGGSGADGVEAGWFSREERGALPLSSMVEKVLRVSAGPLRPSRPGSPDRRRG